MCFEPLNKGRRIGSILCKRESDYIRPDRRAFVGEAPQPSETSSYSRHVASDSPTRSGLRFSVVQTHFHF